MWRVMGSSTQESDPTDDALVRLPEPRAVPSLDNARYMKYESHHILLPTELLHNYTTGL
jgi:hypothetical protein